MWLTDGVVLQKGSSGGGHEGEREELNDIQVRVAPVSRSRSSLNALEAGHLHGHAPHTVTGQHVSGVNNSRRHEVGGTVTTASTPDHDHSNALTVTTSALVTMPTPSTTSETESVQTQSTSGTLSPSAPGQASPNVTRISSL